MYSSQENVDRAKLAVDQASKNIIEKSMSRYLNKYVTTNSVTDPDYFINQ